MYLIKETLKKKYNCVTVFQSIYPWDDERKKNNRPLLHGLIGSGIPAQI